MISSSTQTSCPVRAGFERERHVRDEARELLRMIGMPANDTQDSAAAEAERRVERAKASLLSRVDALKHKFGDARAQINLPAQIAKYPIPAIGVAFALGAFAALGGSRRSASQSSGEHSLTRAALATLAAFGLRIARELAIGQLGNVAKQWWNQRSDEVSPREARTSRSPDLAPFLEH
jgi:ElaB/YqjD/DUF883 family membrane-anchored ribosome-binding protein